MLPRNSSLPYPPEIDRRATQNKGRDQLAHFLRTVSDNPEVRNCSLSTALSRIFRISECMGSDERAQAEEFIRLCFMSEHGAHISHYLPRLFRLETRRGELAATFGLRCAGEGKLFLEKYLDQPIESELAATLGVLSTRDKIVEVGNLAAALPGAVRWLVIALTVELFQEGYEWVVFTGTNELRNGFHRLGLRPVELRLADAARLDADERSQWGSYYSNNPVVMAGNIRHGYNEMNQLAQFPKPGSSLHPVRS